MDTDRLIPRVRAFAADHTPALASGRAVLAVSGGTDSIATAALLIDAGIIRPDVSVVAHFGPPPPRSPCRSDSSTPDSRTLCSVSDDEQAVR